MEPPTNDVVLIADVGPWDVYPTVTNDAEDVVKKLTAIGRLKPGRQLLYYDSEGVLSELLHDGAGVFLGFAPVRRKDGCCHAGS